MNFSESLQALLKNRNMRQADLCRLTGIRSSLMSDYISGKKSPTIRNAVLIADALHISLDTLVGREPDPCQPPKDGAVLSELLQEIKGLPKKEQLYLLDVIRALKARFGETDGF